MVKIDELFISDSLFVEWMALVIFQARDIAATHTIHRACYLRNDGTNQSYLSWINIYTGSTACMIQVPLYM